MCRLLAIKSSQPFDCTPHLRALAQISQQSDVYQGHGWGCACLTDDAQWRLYHDIRPIWEDRLDGFGSTRMLIAHARSAFRDEGIVVENNMPFEDGKRVFAFNGELQGVRIREAGRIGAERIFNFIKRFDKGDLAHALDRGVRLIEQRTRYVRAMNILLADAEQLLVASLFNEEPEYFTLHARERNGLSIVCSAPYPGEDGWTPIPNRTVRTLP